MITETELRELADDMGSRHPDEAAKACMDAANTIEKLRETLQSIISEDWRRWEELATPDEFVRWAKQRANHALQPNAQAQARPEAKP